MNLTIHTYGGAEILYKFFNAIAMLFNSSGGIVQPLAVIVASIGFVFAMTRAMFSSSLDSFITRYFLPLLIIPGLFMVPSSTAHIEDVFTGKFSSVDNVPLFFAKFSELTSTLSYKITTAIETAMHNPNDPTYTTTGMLFGADVSFDISRYKISNADLEKNLRNFSKQCVLYDLAFGRYSLNDLQTSSDLWGFLKGKTSNIRMIHYKDPTTKKGAYLSCASALDKMEAIFEKESNYQANTDLIKNLPLTLQVLTNIQDQKQEDLSKQLLMMNYLAGDFSAGHFSVSRAQAQQQSNFLLSGANASRFIVNLRMIIEIILYVSILFIVPFSVFPGGIKYLIAWAQSLIWIQLWPPLYAVINYIIQITAKGQAAKILGIADSTTQTGLNFITSVGLENINSDMAAIAGYASLSVPFISSFIVYASSQSLSQLTSSIMGPVHSAASMAASELETGNYSFANTSFGQFSYANSSSFQNNSAPTLSSGFMTENRGDHATTYTPDKILMDQKTSNLVTSYYSDQNAVENLQRAHQYSQSSVDSAQKNYAETCSQHVRTMGDITEHLSQSQSYNDSHSISARNDIQESARYLVNEAENFGKAHNLSTRESMDLLGGVGTGMGSWFVDAKLSHTDGVNKDEIFSAAKNMSSNQDFQRHYQKIQDFASNQSHSILNDEGKRIVEGFTRSLDEVSNSQEQYQASLNQMNQISENLSWMESQSQSVKQNLNQEFVDWASEKYSSQGGFSYVSQLLNGNYSLAEKGMLSNEFLQSVRQESGYKVEGFQSPESHFSGSDIKVVNPREVFSQIKSEMNEEIHNSGLGIGETLSKASSIYREEGHISDSINTHMQDVKSSAANSNISSDFAENYQTAKTSHLYGKLENRFKDSAISIKDIMSGNWDAEGRGALSGHFPMTEQPFWLNEDK